MLKIIKCLQINTIFQVLLSTFQLVFLRTPQLRPLSVYTHAIKSFKDNAFGGWCSCLFSSCSSYSMSVFLNKEDSWCEVSKPKPTQELKHSHRVGLWWEKSSLSVSHFDTMSNYDIGGLFLGTHLPLFLKKVNEKLVNAFWIWILCKHRNRVFQHLERLGLWVNW